MTEQHPFEPLGLPPQPDAPQPVPAPAPDRGEPFWTYSDVLIIAGLAIPCLLLGVGFVKVLEFLFHFHAKVRMIELLPAQFLGYGLLFTALFLLFKWQYGRPVWRSLGWTPLRMPALLVFFAGMLTAVGVSLVSILLQTPATSNPMTEMLEDPTSLALVALFGVTLGPLFEELFFRGFVQPLLVRSLGVPLGILVTSVPFGLLHFQEYGNSWRHVVLISLTGAALGAMRQFTGSTKASTLMHASYNALFFGALLVQRGQLRH
jgi:membrane protease YdiL (CAAX protease family)